MGSEGIAGPLSEMKVNCQLPPPTPVALRPRKSLLVALDSRLDRPPTPFGLYAEEKILALSGNRTLAL
jgi:hypothetical protein